MPSTQHHRTRSSHRWRVRLHLAWSCIGGILLFGFSVLHGINSSDADYMMELIVAWGAAALGLYSGIYVLKRGHRKQRIMAAIALAVIGSSMAVVTLLNRTPEPAALPPRPADLSE